MRDKLWSLMTAMITIACISYFFIISQGMPPETVLPITGTIFAIWFAFWFSWAFRWVTVLSPLVITYIMFTFYDFGSDVVGVGGIISSVLFALTGIQQYFANRNRKKREKETRKEIKRLEKLKRSIGE